MPVVREGVIRFRYDHRHEALPAGLAAAAGELSRWRRVLIERGWLGRDPGRYDGAAFGNLSRRVAPAEAPPGRRSFLVSGSGTGELADLGLAGFALVEGWDTAAHRLTSRGLVEPSSESLTHAALYDASAAVGAVVHVHAPGLWARRGAPGLPVTDPAIGYGSAEMAVEVGRLCRRLAEPAGLIAMGGHQDGILAFAPDAATAARALAAAL